jgi:hypothetical protein
MLRKKRQPSWMELHGTVALALAVGQVQIWKEGRKYSADRMEQPWRELYLRTVPSRSLWPPNTLSRL